MQLDDNKVLQQLYIGGAHVDRLRQSFAQALNHVLLSLGLVAQFDQDLVARQRKPHIVLHIVALRLDVIEDIVGLLDKCTFQFCSLSSVEAELRL